jgi:dGTP triphosphohydrolase
LGLNEGFSDNNNNFIVIEKNQISISDYTLASLIKYPDRLYNSQKGLLRILNKSIQEDIKNFEGKIKINELPSRTIACEIMDEADRNSYVCSDLADCFSLKIADSFSFKKILEEDRYYSSDIKNFLISIIYAIDNYDKTLIKKNFSVLKNLFNQNYFLGDDLKLEMKDCELKEFREELFKIEDSFFIKNKQIVEQRQELITALDIYINDILSMDINNFPSRTYRKKYQEVSSKEDKLKIKRDMIAETTDWYVLNYVKNKKKDNI